jgi:Holliday junction resolvase
MKGWPIMAVETEKRRFAILRHLHETQGRELSDELLKHGCRAMGIPSSGDQVRTAIAWLEEQDLVVTQALGRMLAVRLTAEGADVVRGFREAPGVLQFGDPI